MKNEEIVLEGITWDHSRALPPLIATAQRFGEMNPGVSVRWTKRTLHEFGHANLADLTDRFDLVIMDHPWVGFAEARDLLVPLQDRFPSEYLKELSAHSAGPSYESYIHKGILHALPVDGATPTACRRPDLLPDIPVAWDDVVSLAREGKVIVPGFHVDLLLNFLGLCATLNDGTVCEKKDEIASLEIACEALTLLQQLTPYLPSEVWSWNPIDVYEAMASSDRWAYCPFAYSYSNYSRRGFCEHVLEFTDTVTIPDHGRIRTILGGTGIGLSRKCKYQEAALNYMAYTASGSVQSTLYAESGGQPAHRSAWENRVVNSLSRNFFSNTLATMDRAVIRPRHDGSIDFQEHAGIPLVRFLREGGKPESVLAEMNHIYQHTACEKGSA